MLMANVIGGTRETKRLLAFPVVKLKLLHVALAIDLKKRVPNL